jgi:zinc protease
MTRTATILSTLLVGIGATSVLADIPPRPENLVFAPLTFEPPKASDYRFVLKDGTPVYMAPSTEFPLVTVTFTFKGGSYLEDAATTGLTGMMASLMRTGGTATLKPAELDEQLDFLATRINVAASDTSVSASMNCLKSNLDESFRLFMDIVRNPGFDQARLDVLKGEAVEGMKQRNDNADGILGREWANLLYGEGHFEARDITAMSLQEITPERMRAQHARIFHPGNLIVSVSGDFDKAEMISRLENAFAGWTKGEPIPDPPAPTATLKPGVYYVQKDIPQGKVVIGMRSIKRDDPDFFPMLVLNDILGGGGFTSRIMQSVRSNEGLAYSANSRFDPNVWYPGDFRAGFQSKSPTVALAIKLIDDEFNRIRSEPVSSEELATAKASFVETFPQNFSSKDSMLRLFVSDEWTKRPDGYWTSFREKINAVSPDDIQRVAQKYLDPSQMAILVVGDWTPIYEGNERASMKNFFDGNATQIPLRDPMTLVPIKSPAK